MLVPLGWLKQYVTWDMSLDEFCEKLTYAGLEVGSIERIGQEWDPDKIRVGEVVAVRPHPNADRLVLVTVNYGAEQPLEVVTGAPNLRVGDAGQKVVFATVGARLIDPYAETLSYQTLKRTKIRGVASEGMVCSEKELGISEEHTGIIILPDDAPVGTPFVEYWGDTVLDLDLTPNLARCFSMVGVARDAAALVGGAFRMPDTTLQAEGAPIEGQVEVIIEDPDLCPRYSAALIKGVKIGPSPLWMQRRLILAGMRPINNVVDITNYVMLEVGQPLHAFDLHGLKPRRPDGPPAIIVRRAHEGEQMMTLDGEERTFDGEMLLITDGGGPVAVAGVMGGLESEVTEQTADVLLESANFDYISVRRTSALLRIPSEAAQRFGRGVDPELTLVALRRAAELMRTLAAGTVAQGFADAYPRPPAMSVIDLGVSLVERWLGIEPSADEIAGMLRPLGFGCEVLQDAPEPTVRVTVPSFRFDVSIPADLTEEIARMYGYDRLPLTLIADEMPPQARYRELELEDRVRDAMVGMGLTEVMSYSMTNLESVARLTPGQSVPDGDAYVRLANPLSREHEYMRQTLMNTSLEMVSRNLRFVERVAIFEIARVYLPQEGELLPDEPRRLSVALSGPRDERSWLSPESEPLGFYDLKGIAETLCEHLGVDNATFAPTEHTTFHPGRVASLSVDGEQIGVLGEVHPIVRGHFDLPDQPVCLLELDLEALTAAAQPTRRFQSISRMPALKQDLAIVVDEGVAADAIEAAIREVGGILLVDLVLFDVYRGEQVGAGKKSLAYSLTFQAPDKTLTSEQAVRLRDRIVDELYKRYGAEMRA
jgi:phenylalanyl-tRNA synthetase beta chain